MNIKSPETIEQNSNISIQQASEMFGILFEDKGNQQVVAKLFEGFPGLIRQQKIEETIELANLGLQDLKNTIA